MEESSRRRLWLTFKDIVDINRWQKIQDSFSAVSGACLRTVDQTGHNLTSPSNEPRLCHELINDPSLFKKFCGSCLPTFLGGRGVVDKNLCFSCLPGLHNFIAPLRINNGETGAYILIGPLILVMRQPKEEYRKIAEELGVDLEYLWNSLVEIKVFSFNGAQAIVELIKDVGEYDLNLAYQNAMQQRELKITKELPKKGRLFNVLLDVAFQISGADVGSIMSYDKGKDVLIIRVSKGIPEEIVKRTRVRLGEGISGIAAKEGRPLLINDNTEDNRIRPYLNRPNLSSAMVLPLRAEDRLVGVMNLGALKTSPTRFDTHNLSLMNRLVDLASVAMTQ